MTVNIPSFIRDLTVTIIGDKVFTEKRLVNVTILNTVRIIEREAFF